MKKKKKFEKDIVIKPALFILGFSFSIFLANLTEKIYSLSLENAINIFSSGILILTGISKGFSIFLAFLLLLVPAFLFLYLWNIFRK